MKTYIYKQTQKFENVKVITVEKTNGSNRKRTTKVYVDNKIVTGHSRYLAEQRVEMASINDVEFITEKNF